MLMQTADLRIENIFDGQVGVENKSATGRKGLWVVVRSWVI